MEKFFCTAGPIMADINYYIDPLKRIDVDEMELLIRQHKYFVLHASRQTGKTTCLLALREYGLGRKRTDLLIRKPLTDHYGGLVQRVVIELKVRQRESIETLIAQGLQQTAEYMDIVGSADKGHLVIFDRDEQKSWDERLWSDTRTYAGRTIKVWGM